VNYLSGALLSILLLPIILKTPGATRLVTVTSALHHLAKLPSGENFNVLGKLNDRGYSKANMNSRYAVSKLFQIFWTRSLASHLPAAAQLTTNCVNPGWCSTSLQKELRESFITNALMKPFEILLARTAEQGGRTLVHAALAPGEQVHGRYMSNCAVWEESNYAIREGGRIMEKRIWRETIAVLSKIDDRVPGIVEQYLEKRAG